MKILELDSLNLSILSTGQASKDYVWDMCSRYGGLDILPI